MGFLWASVGFARGLTKALDKLGSSFSHIISHEGFLNVKETSFTGHLVRLLLVSSLGIVYHLLL